MNKYHLEIIEESIRLELNAAALYMVFFEEFPEDGNFWWKLAIEEKNHAALLKSIRDIFLEITGVPEDIFAESVEDLKRANSHIEKLARVFKETRPSREEAFNTALSLEETAGEAHFQGFMADSADDSIARVFRQLNGEDSNHALRLREYMDEACIPIH